MSYQSPDNRNVVYGQVGTAAGTTFDAGLRSYMLRIYNYMTVGLALTGVTAWVTAHTPALLSLFYTTSETGTVVGLSGLGWIMTLAPLGLVLALGFGIQSMRAATARNLFLVYSVLMGLSLSAIFLTYTSESIARTFFVTAGTFAGVSLWGYTTRRDLTGMGHFMMMGLIGLVIASLVSLFFQSSAMQFAISVIGVVVFTGLTAWDTQKLKEMYSVQASGEATAKLAVMGALTLYMDFINLFLYLLRFLGRRE